MTRALTQQFVAILDEANVTAEFKQLLDQNGVLSWKDFVLAARSDKARVDQELISANGLTSLSAKIAVRKAWASPKQQRNMNATLQRACWICQKTRQSLRRRLIILRKFFS